MKETKPEPGKPSNSERINMGDTTISGADRRLWDDSDERLHELRVYQAELEMQNEELRAAQEALAESRDRFSALFHQAPVGYVVLDEVGLILEANETFARMVHCPMDGIRGRAFAAFLKEDHSRTFQSRFRALFRNPKGKSMEVELRSGERSLSVQLDASFADSIKAPTSSKASALLLTVSDISDRKRAEEERRYSLSLLEAALESTADGILIVAADGTWSGFNQKFTDMWKIPPWIAKSGDDRRALEHVLSVVADPDEFLATVKEIYGDSHGVSFDTVVMKDGRILERYSQRHRVGDQIVGRVWSFRDITDQKRDRKRLEESLKETQGLLDASRAVLECRGFEEAARRIFDSCREATGAPSGYIALLSDDGEENELVFLESGGLPCSVDPGLPMPVRGLRAEAYSAAEVVYENDFMNSQWVRYMPPGHVNMRNVLFAPIMSDGKAVGVIGLANKPEDFTPEDVRITRALGDMAAIALRRSRAEEDLRRSERLMETILDTIPAPVFYKDVQGVYLGCNRAFQELMGLSKDSILGRTALDIAPPELARRYHEADLGLMEQGEIQVYETEVENALGDRRQVVFHKAPFCDQDGGVMGIVGALLDITERQQAEQRLKSAHERTKALMDSVQAGIILVRGEDRVIVEANPAAARLMNVPMEELIGSSAKKYLCPKEADQCPVFDMAHDLDTSEDELRTRDGRKIPILKTVTRIEINGKKHLLESFVDISDLKQTEEELRRSREQFMLAVNGAQDGIWDWDLRDGTLFLSPKWKEMIGYRDEEITNDFSSFEDRVHPEDKPRVMQALDRYLKRQTPVYSIDFRFRHRDGSYRWILARGEAIFDESGNPLRMAGSHTDITQRKQVEEALRRANEVLVRSPAVAFTWKNAEDWPVEYASENVEQLFGWKAGDFVSGSVGYARTIHPDDLPRVWEEVFRAAADPQTYSVCHEPYRIVARDGTTKWVQDMTSVRRDKNGKILAYEGILLDITDIKNTQEELNKRLNYEAKLAEASAGLLSEKSPNENITDALSCLRKAAGVSRSYLFENFEDTHHGLCMRLICEDCALGVPARMDDPLFQHVPYSHGFQRWREILSAGNVIKGEVDTFPESERIMARPQGIRSLLALPLWVGGKWLGFIGFDATDPAGNLDEEEIRMLKTGAMMIGGYLTLIRTETALRRAKQRAESLNESLRNQTLLAEEMAERAARASSAKSEFLANMSHEIRTPMNGVIGMTGLLLDTGLTEEQRRYAEVVKSSGESLLAIINDILDFSKIEAGKLDLEVLDFNLQDLLDDFSATMALRAHQKGLEWLCSAAPDVPLSLRGDPVRLRQVLTNLAGNAVKFTHTGEVAVLVSTASQRGDDVLLKFSVRDTGIGIPENKLSGLFTKFFQADASTTRQFGGTGLGLAISKQLVQMMGGDIWLESREGEGSEFHFTLRFVKGAPDTSTESQVCDVLKDVRTLIVDDNATNREILMTRLRFWGMRPAEAADGPSALETLLEAKAQGDPFRLAVIDMQMPGMAGEELAQAVKADRRLSDTRMVMLTSLGTQGDIRRLNKIGSHAALSKPVRHRDLHGVLSQVLSGSEPLDGTSETELQSGPEPTELFSGRNVRILLAEDNFTNQQVALGMLKKLGLQADAVADGNEALKALSSFVYDLVLLDVQMPVMDGIETARRIRDPHSDVLNHRVPIIAMTAHAMKGDREKCLQAGMDDYLTKPIVLGTLAAKLQIWMGETERRDNGTENSETALEELPVFDRVGALKRLGGDESLLKTIGEIFLQDVPSQIQNLKECFDRGDTEEFGRYVHSIKGASAGVGGERLRNIAAEMEQAARSGSLDKAGSHMNELETQFATLKELLQSTILKPTSQKGTT